MRTFTTREKTYSQSKFLEFLDNIYKFQNYHYNKNITNFLVKISIYALAFGILSTF